MPSEILTKIKKVVLGLIGFGDRSDPPEQEIDSKSPRMQKGSVADQNSDNLEATEAATIRLDDNEESKRLADDGPHGPEEANPNSKPKSATTTNETHLVDETKIARDGSTAVSEPGTDRAISSSEGTDEFELVEKEAKLEPEIKLHDNAFFFGRENWKAFKKAVNQAESRVRIATNKVSPESLSEILALKSGGVDVQIITKRAADYEGIYDIVDRKQLKRYKRFHSKVCVIDDDLVLIGSSNLIYSDLGGENAQRPAKINADIVSTDPQIITECNQMFDIFWKQSETADSIKTDSSLLSSISGIPTRLEDYFRNSTEEIVIIVPQLFEEGGAILTTLREETPADVLITIVTHHKMQDRYEDEIREMQESNNIKLILTDDLIHAKLYVFDWDRAVISSVNFNITSWCFSFETGFVTTEDHVISEIQTQVKAWENQRKPAPKYTTSTQSSEELEDVFRLDAKDLPVDLEGQSFYQKIKRQLDSTEISSPEAGVQSKQVEDESTGSTGEDKTPEPNPFKPELREDSSEFEEESETEAEINDIEQSKSEKTGESSEVPVDGEEDEDKNQKGDIEVGERKIADEDVPYYVTFITPSTLQDQALDVLEAAHETGRINFGKNDTERSIEDQQSDLVYIAEDIDPEDVVDHLPDLADKKDIPYLFIEQEDDLADAVSYGGPHCSSATIIDAGDASQELEDVITKIEELRIEM